MRKCYLHVASMVIAVLLSITSFAQTTTNISGIVRNGSSKEVVPAVSVSIKGTNQGTFTDEKGNFKLSTNQKPPLTLVITSIGFEQKEVIVNSANENLEVEFTPVSSLGAEVVVSASRVPERILESPVSIERMGSAAIRNAAVPNFYEATANLKGVDLTTSSLTFRTISTRGFNGSGNLRFNQLMDGMDNQAPALNFAVGNVLGMSELDVDNVELLQGASSALYGSGGMNGTMLMTSKSPFKYQGLSFQVKQGVMHVDGKQRPAAPYYDWALRWGKKVSEKFAFKFNAQFISAKDWQADDQTNLERNNVFSSVKPGTRASDPNYDGVSVFGDEASASMNAFAQVVRAQVGGAPGGTAITGAVDGLLTAGQTSQQIATFFGSNPATAPYAQYLPFLIPTSPAPNNPYRNTYGGQLVSRTGYQEKDLVDYNTYNIKLSGGLYYKITDNIEASLLAYWGTGTTVYTGADRYALKNFKLGQYKLEFKGKNWFLRGYTTQENSGDSYTATTAAVSINNGWKDNATWFQQYTGTYGAGRLGIIPNPGAPGTFLPVFPDAQAHGTARGAAETGMAMPGTTAFNTLFQNAINTPVSKGGAKFADKSDLFHYEGQLNLSEYIKFVDVLVGASFRQYNINSEGTIFADTTGAIKIKEYGGYIQLQKSLFNDVLKLTASGRYDKNENFEGRFTPRVTALIKVAKDNHFRLSYQMAYRFPSTQDQWINLRTPSSILIGGLPNFNTYYKFSTNPAYTSASIVAYRASISAGAPNPTLLKAATFKTVKPETVRSYEVGYRGLLTRRLLVDAYVYYSQYENFIAREAVGRGVSGNPANAPTELASPFTTTNYSFVVNTAEKVDAIGWGISVDYQMGRGFNFTANVSSDKLNNVPANVVTFFNTPKLRYNIGLGNNKIAKFWGFNLMYRWQDNVYWEGTFGSGEIPSFGSLDAQVNYRLPKYKSIVKLGASNVLNKYYRSAFGNPYVGGVYYISFGYNIF